jgi:hypothetical protein
MADPIGLRERAPPIPDVDILDLKRRRESFTTVVSEVKFGRWASRGEVGAGRGMSLNELPQIMGGGGR